MPWKIENPGTSEAWLTQPVATVLASAGVLLAALVAYTAAILGRKQTEKHFGQSHGLTEVRGLRDRFTTIAGQLADPSAAVRIAGIYAMEALVGDWLQRAQPREAQACINVLCSYLRLHHAPGDRDHHQTKQVIHRRNGDHEVEDHLEYRQDDSQVRQSIIRTISAHLQDNAHGSWSDLDFDFTGAYLESADFAGAIFRGEVTFREAHFVGAKTSFEAAKITGNVSFAEATFTGEETSFVRAIFTGELVSFERAQFAGDVITFERAQFIGDATTFKKATFTGSVTQFWKAQFTGKGTAFTGAQFTGERTMFDFVQFTGDSISFWAAQFTGNATSFENARFEAETTDFETTFTGKISFDRAQFSGKRALFGKAQFTGPSSSFAESQFTGVSAGFEQVQFASKRTTFRDAVFAGSKTSFAWVQFTGEKTYFDGVQFKGETSFKSPKAWQNVHFDWDRDLGLKPSTVRPDEWPPAVEAE